MSNLHKSKQYDLIENANSSDKETSFLDSNVKVIDSDVHTSVYDKRDDFRFPNVNFPWLSGDVTRLPSYGVYISQLVRCASCCIIAYTEIHISKASKNVW